MMRKTVLIVDDDTDLLEVLSQNLIHAGFSVVTASNGVEGLKMARSLLPDLVVLDLVLPEMDGFTVCERLRRDRATAGIPVLMLTGLTSQLNRFAGLESGANDYIVKPVTPDELVNRVNLLLDHSSASPPQGQPIGQKFLAQPRRVPGFVRAVGKAAKPLCKRAA